jgi:calcineurin-like phosphoesterase family protein
MKKIILLAFALLIVTITNAQNNKSNFVFCSDVHYGLFKNHFQGKDSVSSYEVNKVMVNQINKLIGTSIPDDLGVGSDDVINSIEAVIITGDIANREEVDKEGNNSIQSATKSWDQFSEEFVEGLKLKNKKDQKSELWITAGNHDVSDAIGFYKKMNPAVDATAYIGIYNMMMKPKTPVTKETFNYETQKVHYSEYKSGVHFQFVNLWPDSEERTWMEKDLDTVSKSTPVLIFTHSCPDVEARFFKNPNGDHSINKTDKFENLLNETFKDGTSSKDTAKIEQNDFVSFLKKHPNIKAYFHGHNNNNEFYTWTGPDNNIQLPCFRVDSPMKGKVSSKDETKLSYQLISIDSGKKLLTVRECFWNTDPTNKNGILKFDSPKTISLQ